MKNPYKNKFEIAVRTIIEYKGKILLCKIKKSDCYFFPGGHLEYGERIDKALAREIKEELNTKVEKFSFIGVVDNIFTGDGDKHHEINFVFKTKIKKVYTLSQENHIDFVLIDKKEFSKQKIFPIALKKQLLKWFKDKKTFWVSQ